MTSSFYLGPRLPRLKARSWEEVVNAAGAGVLDETQWVELKQAVPASSKPANLELAKDLASLSVDGGVLVVGISDAGGAAGEVLGVDLAGLETRIGQVATGRISPPLPVTLDAVPHPDQSGIGVLLVTVPASEGAPHMVDGQYWGRGSQGKRVLSDDEVRRLMGDRQSRAASFAQRLRGEPARLDPPTLNPKARLYVLLEPAAEAREPLTDLLAGKHVLQVVTSAVRFNQGWGPSFASLSYAVPHPDGLAAASMPPDDSPGEDQAFFFALLDDDGAVHVSAPAARRYGSASDAPDAVSPGQLLQTVHGAVVVAGHLAAEHTGYQGPWRAGVLVTKLRGLLPSQAHSDLGFQRFSSYPAEDYEAVTTTTTLELVEHPPAVVERLTRRLLRGLGVEGRFLPYTDPAELLRL